MIKYFEIRDKATMIAAFAVLLYPAMKKDVYLHRRMGWADDDEPIYLVWEQTHEAHSDPFGWGVNPRTMYQAHLFIRDHWDDLETGSVIDVEYILGETDAPRDLEREET